VNLSRKPEQWLTRSIEEADSLIDSYCDPEAGRRLEPRRPDQEARSTFGIELDFGEDEERKPTHDAIRGLVHAKVQELANAPGLAEALKSKLGIEPDFSAESLGQMNLDSLREDVSALLEEKYEQKEKDFGPDLMLRLERYLLLQTSTISGKTICWPWITSRRDRPSRLRSAQPAR